MELKKTILRQCALSYTLLMKTISSDMKSNFKDAEAIIEKGLATQAEIDSLGTFWTEKWWIPINWACCRAQKEQNADGHLPYEGHEVILTLVKFKENLTHLAEYSHNPLPGICTQAVYLVFWSFLFFGAINLQTVNFENYGFGGIFFVSFKIIYFLYKS